MSQPTDDVESEDNDTSPLDTSPESVDIDDIIHSFLRAYPSPSDAQVHGLAAICGMDYKEFEQKIYKMFGQAVKNAAEDAEDMNEVMEDFTDPDIDEDEELEDENPLDMFLLLYFMFNDSPTDEQIHSLAEMIGKSPEELEEALYRLLSEYDAEAGDEDELDSGTPDEDETSDDGDELDVEDLSSEDDLLSEDVDAEDFDGLDDTDTETSVDDEESEDTSEDDEDTDSDNAEDDSEDDDE